MKTGLLLAGCAVLFALPAAHAQTVLAHASSSAPPPSSALPPPGINDAGPATQSIPLPSTGLRPSVAPAAQQRDGKGEAPPDVAVTTNTNGDTVETYSRNGHAYMVRVTPKHGVPQTYHYDNANGSLVHDPRLGPVAPVYYTLYKWGGAAKPASSTSSGQ
ncbi:MAG TPA: DUF2782 domain-containing protein [Rhodanobacteraceae bacterium]|nr:DUF2782 domain-containing protein [Rhodanobacteraceae bacterium]